MVINSRFNDLLEKYVGRNQAIRYCQYVERQYIATDKDNRTWTITPATDKQNLAYINSYKAFQDFTGTQQEESKELQDLKKRLGITIVGHQ